jgi:hypothetical protein
MSPAPESSVKEEATSSPEVPKVQSSTEGLKQGAIDHSQEHSSGNIVEKDAVIDVFPTGSNNDFG